MSKTNWRQHVADEMIRLIEQGTAPWQKPWAAGVVGHNQHNPTSDRAYRGINALWLEAQGHSDPRWLTFKQAREMGAQVRGGEKATQVEYWKWTEKRPVLAEGGVPVLDDNNKMKYETVKLQRPQVFYANVFNAEQIDGLEPFKAPEPSFEPIEAAEKLLTVGGVKIQHDQRDKAFYQPSRDQIHLPDKSSFTDAYEYYATAMHELGHATGHSSRLHRDFGPFGSEVYAKEELRAELTSYIVARDLGLGHFPDRHASYLENWVKAIKEDRNVLFQAARDAEQIVLWIKEPELRPTLERSAQDKRKAVKMERTDQEKEQLAAHRDNAFQAPAHELQESIEKDEADLLAEQNIPAHDVYESFSSFYDQGEPSTDEYLSAEYADQFSVKEKETAVLDIRKALHTEDGKAFLAAVQKNGLDPQSAFFVEKLKARLDIAAKSNLIPAKHILKTIEEKTKVGGLESIKALWTEASSLDRMKGLQTEFHESNPSKARSLAIHNELSDNFGSDGKATMFLNAEIRHSPLFVRFGNHQTASDYAEGKITEIDAIILDLNYTQQLGDTLSKELLRQKESYQKEKPQRVYLAVPFAEKDQAKALGAKWDRKQKSWFAPKGVELAPFEQWKPENQVQRDDNTLDPAEEFKQTLQDNGVVLKGAPVMDGNWHRVSLADDPKGTQNGSYRAFLDGRPNGQIKDFKTGDIVRWVARGERPTPEQRAALLQVAAERKVIRAAELKEAQEKAASVALGKWDKSIRVDSETGSTAYLSRKGVKSYGLHIDGEGKLLVPARDTKGKLWSVQTIDQEGEKRFLKNGRKTGLMHVVDPHGKIAEKPGLLPSTSIGKGTVFIAEGYATAVSVYEATNRPTVVAFDAGNLKPVAEAIRKQYPKAKIVIASDNDHKLENTPRGNVGLDAAYGAALAVGGGVVKPGFTPEEKLKGMSDWNDLAEAWGTATVVKQMRQQLKQQKTMQVGNKPGDLAISM